MQVLKGVKPQRVMSFFEDICSIPHGSGNTAAIGDYCTNKAREMGLFAVKDDMGNVVIKKPASKGYENHPTVILQAHLDMVCEKTPETNIDFENDAIKIMLQGDYITANGTTLGGDDGIGMALILAVLEDKTLKHPPLEALFTVDEETGMFGAAGLDASLLSGRTMINIDSEEEGVLTVSCAGGASTNTKIPLEVNDINMPCYEVQIGGLLGGHSGVEINKGRKNANILLGHFLNQIKGEYSIINISGGSKENAIPARAVCQIATAFNIKNLADDFKATNTTQSEPDLSVTVTPIANTQKGFSYESSKKITAFLCGLKNGVIAMSKNIEDLPQTSLNLGILATNENSLSATISVRSSVNDEKLELIKWLKDYALSFGAEFLDGGYYPAWEYNEKSNLRQVMVNEYEALFGKKPLVMAIHAGLECGLLSEKLPGLDAVSFGPNMSEIHTPNERLSISSTQRSYKYLCSVLERL